ncbi:MAG: GerMN domain-containing protein [Candidatus Margulisbacteria bacterium]|nr:GerMN domain-containing protein [Candidatus Margulisiibacteriota bacterium]
MKCGRLLFGMKRKARKKTRPNLYYLALAGLTIAGLAFLAWSNFSLEKKSPGVGAYFFKGEKLISVERPLRPDVPPLKQAIEALLSGPTPQEAAEGITTQLPAGVKIRQLKVEKTIAVIDLSRELEDYGGGSAKVEGLIAQLVFTVTDIPGIKKAWIWVEGHHDIVLGGEGLVLDRPLGREDVKY